MSQAQKTTATELHVDELDAVVGGTTISQSGRYNQVNDNTFNRGARISQRGGSNQVNDNTFKSGAYISQSGDSNQVNGNVFN